MTEPIGATLDPFARGATVDCSLAYMGSVLSFLVNAAETGGGLSILQSYTRRGNEPPPHVHLHEHEIFFILDGEVEYFCEGTDRSLVARSGELVFLPQQKAHAFYYRTPEVKVLTILHAPGGGQVRSEQLFRKMATGPAPSMSLPDDATRFSTADATAIEKVVKLAAEHDAILLSPDEIARRLPNYPGFGAHLGDAKPTGF